jgi:REP element-mobilizing transposase RayT
MPRKPREEVAGGVHHVYARGVRREPLFLDDEDRAEYLSIWGAVARESGWRCLGYCLMDNHVHHLVETPKPNLGIGMQTAHGRYGRYFNKAYRHVGHVFENRYGATRAKNDGALWYFASYVVLNPVRAGMCDRPEDHPWSSHGAAIGDAPRPTWLDVPRLLEFYDTDGNGSPERYAHIVEMMRLMGAAGFEPATSRV